MSRSPSFPTTTLLWSVLLALMLSTTSAVSMLKSLSKTNSRLSIIPEERDTVDRDGRPINGKFYFTGDKLRAWHGSNIVIDDRNLGQMPIWLASWSTNSLAAAMKKVSEGVSDDIARKKFIYMHLYQIEENLQLVNLVPDANENRNTLKSVMGKDPETDSEFEPGFTMGNPSRTLPTTIPISGLCRKPLCGWRSAWDQDELMICQQCQSKLRRHALYNCSADAIAKRLGVDSVKKAVESKVEIKESEKEVLEQELESYESGVRDLMRLKKAKDTGKLKSFDMQLKGGVGILKLLKKEGSEAAAPCVPLF